MECVDDVSQANTNVYDSKVVITEISPSEDHSVNGNFLTPSYGENDGENYEQAPGINTEDASHHLHFPGEHDLDKTLESEKEKIPREFSEIENTPLNVSPVAIFTEVTQEELDTAEVIHGINTGEEEEFKEVSVQTVEERFFSCQGSCPICRLDDEDLKKKLTILCLECPPYKKRRVAGDECFVDNNLQLGMDDVDTSREEREAQECGPNEKILHSHQQILPNCMSFITNDAGENRDGKEFPCRKIRLGLSRSVKLASLHKTPASRKRNIADSS